MSHLSIDRIDLAFECLEYFKIFVNSCEIVSAEIFFWDLINK